MQDAKLMVRGPDGEWMEVSGNGDEIWEVIEAARKEIGEAVDTAHSEADRAQRYADDCLESASDAHKSAETAQFYGQDAKQSAETANTAAQGAREGAEEARRSADSAETHAQTARDAANRAEAAGDELGTVLSGGADGKFLGHADGRPQWVDAPAGGSGGASTETLEAAIARHNASGSAHQDIRALIGTVGGVGIKKAYVNDNGQLVIELTDGSGYVSESLRGPTGAIGPQGKDGYTPVRGTDYWTPADQESIVQRVLAELGATPVYGTIDEDNNIYLTALLKNGTYHLKYADSDGNVTDICTYVHNYVPAPSYTNLFVAETCTLNSRTNSSGGVSSNTGCFLTDFIDLGTAMAGGGTNVLHYKGMYFNTDKWTSQYEIYGYICYYDANKSFIVNENHSKIADVLLADGDYVKELNASYTNARYIRVSASILPNPSSATPIVALTSKDQLANCKIALNETITD